MTNHLPHQNNTQSFAKLFEEHGMDDFDEILKDKEEGENDVLNPKNIKQDTPLYHQATIDLHTQNSNEAQINTENFIENCRQKNLSKVLIITGKGTGVINKAVHEILNDMQQTGEIKRYKNAPGNLGGQGAFVVILN